MTFIDFHSPVHRDGADQDDTFDPRSVVWVESPSSIRALKEHLRLAGLASFDTETTGLDEHATSGGDRNGGVAARIAMATFTVPVPSEFNAEPTNYVVPLSHPQGPFAGSWRSTLADILEHCLEHKVGLIAQNGKFDSRWCYAATDLDLSGNLVWDTMLSSGLLDENENKSLKPRAAKTFGIEQWDDGIDFSKPGEAERIDYHFLGLYACIAEGSKVLTDRGYVPIENVTTEMKLWDGVEWVEHDGIVFKGTQQVVDFGYGFRATPDHLVLTDQGDYACAASIASGERRVATLTNGGAGSELHHPDWKDEEATTAPAGRGQVLSMRQDLVEAGERSTAWPVGMHVPELGEVGKGSKGQGIAGSVSRDAAEMHPRNRNLRGSRGSGDRAEVQLGGGVHQVGAQGATSPNLQRGDVRPDRRQQALRTGEPSIGDVPPAGDEHQINRVCGVHGAAGCTGSSMASGENGSPGVLSQQGWTREEIAAWNDRAGIHRDPGEGNEVVPVYDILNAGSRNRFTVSGVVVSNCRDTYWTWKLARHHILSMTTFEIDGQPTEEEIVLSGLYRLMTELVQPTFRTITKVEQRGIYLDPEGVQREIEEQEKIVRELEPEIVNAYPVEEEYGTPSLEPVSKWFKRWAELAVEAGEFVVIETTPSGHPSWGAAVLKKLQRVHGSGLAGNLLELRVAKKKLQFLKAWLGKVTRHGKIHASYNVGRTVTGRLSSSDPNMQQVTRSLKPSFSPSPGYYLAEIDYSQIELRVAAHISGSKAMIEAYRSGQDLHKMIAARTARISIDEVTKEQRQAGKAANFGLIYGMSAEGFQSYAEAAYGVEMTLEEATKFREEFFNLWDGLTDWHHRMIDEAAATGQVISPLGRVRRLPDIRSSWVGARSDAERQAINSPVQGTASDMMMLAASAISGEIKDVRGIPEVRMVGTVHDSILVEVPQDGWEFWTREVMGYMTEEVPRLLEERFGVKLAVPLECEATVGSRWGLDDVGTLE